MTKKELSNLLKDKAKSLTKEENDFLEEEIKAFRVQDDDFKKLVKLIEANQTLATNPNNLLSFYLLGLAPKPIKLRHYYSLSDMADIDGDFSPDGRDIIKDWLKKKFGEENCVSIGTYGTLGVKGSVQEVSRVYDIKPSEYLTVSKLVSDDDKDLSIDEIKEKYPPVADFLKDHPEVEETMTKLTGTKKSISQHAGGFVVSSDNVFEHIPIVKANKGYVTGWIETGSTKELEPLGFIKVDLLGLGFVSLVQLCVKEINRKHGKDFIKDPYMLPVDDPKVYDFINTLQLDNIFQMESRVFVEAVRMIKPRSLEDISNISTLIRPGAACTVEEYKKAEHIDFSKIPKCLHKIYAATRGYMLYQEQLLQILMELGGFTIFEADKVRRLVRKIGKSKTSEENRDSMYAETDAYKIGYLKHAIQKITQEDNWPEEKAKEYAESQWDALMGQAKYCLEENELIKLANGKRKKIKHLKVGDVITAYTNGKLKDVPVVQKHDNGMKEVYEVTTDKGTVLRCTGDHKFMTNKGLKTLMEIWNERLEILERSDVK